MRTWTYDAPRHGGAWQIKVEGETVARIALWPGTAEAQFIVDACNAAEQVKDGVIFDGIGPVFTVRNGGVATCEGVGVEVYRNRLSPRGHAVMEDMANYEAMHPAHSSPEHRLTE